MFGVLSCFSLPPWRHCWVNTPPVHTSGSNLLAWLRLCKCFSTLSRSFTFLCAKERSRSPKGNLGFHDIHASAHTHTPDVVDYRSDNVYHVCKWSDMQLSPSLWNISWYGGRLSETMGNGVQSIMFVLRDWSSSPKVVKSSILVFFRGIHTELMYDVTREFPSRLLSQKKTLAALFVDTFSCNAPKKWDFERNIMFWWRISRILLNSRWFDRCGDERSFWISLLHSLVQLNYLLQ